MSSFIQCRACGREISPQAHRSEKAPNRTYTASFEHDYYVENPARGEWIDGAAAVELQIAISDDGVPRVISEKQKTLRKEKGTMQPR